jgi:hypothetical protein
MFEQPDGQQEQGGKKDHFQAGNELFPPGEFSDGSRGFWI